MVPLDVTLIRSPIHHGLSEKHAGLEGRLCENRPLFMLGRGISILLLETRGDPTFTAFHPDVLASVCVALPDPSLR